MMGQKKGGAESPSKSADAREAPADLLERLVAPSAVVEVSKKDSPVRSASLASATFDNMDDRPPTDFRRRLRELLEEPESSWAAAIISLLMWWAVVLSLLAVALESIPDFDPKVHPEWAKRWNAVEITVVTVFTTDYVLRFWATYLPTCHFICKAANVIDLVSILPFFTEELCQLLLPAGSNDGSVNLIWLRVLRLGRLLRVFKFSKYHALAEVLIETFTSAMEALLLLVCCIGVATVVCGGLAWTVEQGDWDPARRCYAREVDAECSPFQSLPSSFYWAITTLTTVGYGDVVPASAIGRFVAGLTMLAGVVTLALPVSVICSHFDKAMTASNEKRQLKAKRRRTAGIAENQACGA